MASPCSNVEHVWRAASPSLSRLGIRGRRLRHSQHLKQRQRPKRRLKRGAGIGDLGQIGYAKTR